MFLSRESIESNRQVGVPCLGSSRYLPRHDWWWPGRNEGSIGAGRREGMACKCTEFPRLVRDQTSSRTAQNPLDGKQRSAV